MYYQVVIKKPAVSSSSLIVEGEPEEDDEEQKQKIVKIEVNTLELSRDVRRQLLVISDISRILRYEQKKLQHNFQQQLTASLAHEQLTPLNSIVNVSQILQKTLQ